MSHSIAYRAFALLPLRGLFLAGCAEPAYGSLPKDEKERAMTCTKAGIAAMAAVQDDKPAFERTSTKMKALANADGFYKLFPGSNEDPGKFVGSEQDIRRQTASNWLETLNNCLTAYKLELEPVPALPSEPVKRSLACAAAVAMTNVGTRELRNDAQAADDPQAAYFIGRAVKGPDAMARFGKAQDDTIDEASKLVDTGASTLWAQQCLSEDAKAQNAQFTLPSDPDLAVEVCDYALTFSKRGGWAVGGNLTADARRYAAAYQRMRSKSLEAAKGQEPAAMMSKVVSIAAESGRLDQIADRCDKQYR